MLTADGSNVAELTFGAVVSPAPCFPHHLYMPSAGLFHCHWLLLLDLHEMVRISMHKLEALLNAENDIREVNKRFPAYRYY